MTELPVPEGIEVSLDFAEGIVRDQIRTTGVLREQMIALAVGGHWLFQMDFPRDEVALGKLICRLTQETEARGCFSFAALLHATTKPDDGGRSIAAFCAANHFQSRTRAYEIHDGPNLVRNCKFDSEQIPGWLQSVMTKTGTA